MAETISIGAVFKEAKQFANRARKSVILVFSILTIPYVILELVTTGPVLGFAYGALGLVSLYLQLWLTSAVLSCALPDYEFDPRSPTKGRFPSAFLMSMIWLLGVAAGLVLLVVPGFILMARWTVSIPVLLAEDRTAMESLGRSWDLTRRHLMVAGFVVLASVVAWAPAIALDLQYPTYGPPPIALALGTNMLFAGASVFSWLMFSALFVLLPKDD